MRDVIALKQERARLIDEARAILQEAEKTGYTPEIEQRHRELLDRAEALSREIQAIERQMALDASLEGRGAPAGAAPAEWRDFGEFIHAVRFSPGDPRLQRRDLAMGTDATGGVLVPPQFLAQILQVDPQAAIFRPRATVIPAGSPPDAPLEIPALDQSGTKGVYSGVTVQWISEGASKPQTEPAFTSVSLQPYEVAAHTVVTDKLLRNAPAAGPLIQTLLRRAIVAAEDTAFLSGNGTGKPTGVLASTALIKVHRATANQVTYADIVTMLSKLLPGARGVWIISPTVLPQLMQMTTPLGQLVWQPDARTGAPGTLFGLPVLENGRSPVLGTLGDVVLADLQYYLIKDGAPLAIDASPHVKFLENKTVIKAFWNVDGKPWLTTPLLLEDGVTTVSPFVALDVLQV